MDGENGLVSETAQNYHHSPDNDATFRLLVESVSEYAIFRLSEAGIVTTWNRGAQRLKGYAAGEIIGRHFSQFYTPDQIDAGHPEEVLQNALAAGEYAEEGWRVRKDGSLFGRAS
ncbi:hypothetical protein BZM26_38380 [Paraburkholderia strydomiana]|nr:hypothetical protein BZM26_38380 [Paraburkholderia strydomiana]